MSDSLQFSGYPTHLWTQFCIAQKPSACLLIHHDHCPSSPSLLQTASYGKKNGVWYASSGSGAGAGPGAGAATGGGGWGRSHAPLSRKASVLDADPLGPAGGKPSSGRVIRIIHGLDHTVQVSWRARRRPPP